jgi:phage gpG-like protein
MLSFEVTGGDKVRKGLAALDTTIKDLRPFWRDVFAPKYFAMVQDLFATTGTPRGPGGKFTGGPWARLSKNYFVWKEKHYPNAPILVRDGTLRASVRWHGTLGPGGIFTAMPGYVIAGTSVPYAQYHQTGTKHMPQREFMPPPDPAVFAPLMKQWILKTSKTGSEA